MLQNSTTIKIVPFFSFKYIKMPATSNTRKTFKSFLIFIINRTICHTLEVLSFFVSLLFSPKKAALPAIDDHNLVTPAVKLSRQIKAGHISSEEVVESFIGRIKSVNPLINAVVAKRFDDALKEAREIDIKIAEARDGSGDSKILDLPLLGVPLSVKETIAVNGYPFTGGLMGRRFVKAQKNAAAVDLLVKNGGLIPVALTNIPEMAMWWDASNPVYGRSNNPYDLSRITGGSSGGEGALLGAAGSVVGIGSDIGGSIRMPAFFNGVFGHKTTPHVVSNEGMYPSCKGEREALLSQGPMTRYACDLLPMLKIMAGKNATRLKLDEPVDLSKIKIFYVEDLGDPLAKKCSAEILAGQREVVGHFAKKFKIPVERVILDEFKYGMQLWNVEMKTKDSLPMSAAFMDGNGEMNPFLELFKYVLMMSNFNFNSIVTVFANRFTPDFGTPLHSFFLQKGVELRKRFDKLVGDNGILIMPTHPEGAPPHYTTTLKSLNVSYTAVSTCLRAPMTQCPVGMTRDGLPFGVQVVSKTYNDRLTIAVAQEIEKAFGGWQAPCRVSVE